MVAEPHSDHVLLQPGLLGDVADLLQGGLRALQEHVLHVAPHSVLDTPSLSLPGLCKGLCFAHLLQILIVVSSLQSLLQQGLQLTHVLHTELQSLEAADGCLAGHLPKENTQSEPHIGLGISQGDPPLLQELGQLLEVSLQNSHVLTHSLCPRGWLSSFSWSSFRAPGGAAQGLGEAPSELLATPAPASTSGWGFRRPPWGTSPTSACGPQ